MLVSLVAFEALAVATVLPVAVQEIGGLALYGWSFSAFMLASLVTTIAAGQQSDRRGPAAPFIAGVAVFGVGLTVAGAAPAMPLFIAGRALQGLGAGAITTVAYVGIGRGYPDRLRPRMLALMSTAWIVPALVGPAVAGVVAERASWRLVFLALLPLLALAAALTLPPLRGMAVTGMGATLSRLPAALRLAAGAGILLAGLDVASLPLVCALVLTGLALAGPALRRILPPGTLRARRGLPAGLAANALLNFGYFTAEAFLPLGLTSLRGLSASAAGLSLTVAAITWTAGAWTQARLDARGGGAGRPARVTAGFGFVLVGLVLSTFALLRTDLPVALTIAGVGLGQGVGGFGIGLAYATISLLVLTRAPAGQEGAISSSLRLAEQLAVAIGAGLGGAAVALGLRLGWTPRTGIGIAFAIALAGALLGLLVSRRLRTSGEPLLRVP